MLKKWVRKIAGRPEVWDLDFQSGLDAGGYILYGLARAMKPSVCVEIGSARGLSACLVGKALKENGKGTLYAIDPHGNTEWNDSKSNESINIMRKHLKYFQVETQVEIVQKYSQEVAKQWTKPIDLLFIDGDHSFEGVKADWDAFTPFVTEFGVVVLHDTTWERHKDSKWYRNDMGVPKFVDLLRKDGFQIVTIDQHCGISLVQPRIGGVPLA